MRFVPCKNITHELWSAWNKTQPDIPLCYQLTVFPLVLVLFWIVFCLPYMIYMKLIHQGSARSMKVLCLIKMLFVVLLFISNGSELIGLILQNKIYSPPPSIYFISPSVICILMIGMFAMILVERSRNAQNSGFYFCYWVINSLQVAIRCRSLIIQSVDQGGINELFQFVIQHVHLGLTLTSLILAAFSDRQTKDKHLRPSQTSEQQQQYVTACSEVDASFLSRVTFWWFNRLVIRGYRHTLTTADLWQLNERDKSINIVPDFLKNLLHYMVPQLPRPSDRRISTVSNGSQPRSSPRCSLASPVASDDVLAVQFTPDAGTGSKGGASNISEMTPLTEGQDDDGAGKMPQVTFVVGRNPGLTKASMSSGRRLDDGENTSGDGDTRVNNGRNNSSNSDQEAPKPERSERQPCDPSLLFALVRTYWPALLLAAVFKLINDMMTFLSPMLLKLLINYIEKERSLTGRGYLYATCMLVVALLQSLLLHQYFHTMFVAGMHIRAVLISAVYRKALALSNTSRRESTLGEIVNLMSVDAQKFLELMAYLNMVWSGPLQIIVAIVLLWQELGPSIMAGVCVMVLLIPLNGFIANITKKLQMTQLKFSDSRIKMMTEILNGIKVLKLYAWEPSFISHVGSIRDKELGVIRKSAYLNASISFTWNCAPFLVSLTAFGVYVVVSRDNILDAEKAFVSLSLFNILRFPLMMLPMVISNIIQASVSLRRLTVFLRRSEIAPDNVSHEETPGVAAVIERGSFAWDPKEEPVLHNVTLHFPEGQLTAVVGPVGSGKSSLISAMLGDMERLVGRVNIKGSVAYVPQQAWISNASLRDNILFYRPLDQTRYDQIIEACALTRDLEILPDGDATEIGEKGINLSGGQKQRVSLARACYADADIYLLDDPLSAVDSHVGRHLLDRVLGRAGILAGRTRVLVTHSITVLPHCDRIVVLEEGRVREMGTYKQLIKHGKSFALFIATHLANQSREGDRDASTATDGTLLPPSSQQPDATNQNTEIASDDDLTELAEREHMLEDLQNSCLVKHDGEQPNGDQWVDWKEEAQHRALLTASKENLAQSRENLKLVGSARCEKKNSAGEIEVTKKSEPRKLVEAEQAQVGQVKLSVLSAYIRSVGIPAVLVVISLYVLTNAASLGSNLWLVFWSNDAPSLLNASLQAKANNLSADARESILSWLRRQRDMRLGVYGALGFMQALCLLGCSICLAMSHVLSSRRLHSRLLQGVLRCPMQFFEGVPTGRLLNRFSQDIATLDQGIPIATASFLGTFFHCLATLVAVILPNQWIIIPLVAVMAFYFFMQRFYVATSRQLKRLESVSRSPIYSHFSETLQGVSSIRAYGLTQQFTQHIEQRVDNNMVVYYSSIVSNRWLAIRLELVGNLIVFLAALFAVVSQERGLDIKAGLVGLSVSYALNITQTLNWMVRMSSDLESNLVSIERIREYSVMEPEAPWEVPESKPPPDWPNGSIEFEGYSTRYRPGLDLVLRDITCTICLGEKVGIVGRTGSGKSSLVLALFRVLESAEGCIRIGGRDIAQLGLHDLRARLTIIPQDPVLFSGTLRFNLDPFNQYSDDEIWDVLELANLKTYVMDTSGADGLQMVVAEGGENLSVGQRQLACLARALLRRCRILVLDEATAAVDLDTDALIQSTIRRQFASATVLTIAHRLNTVLDYDRIMVLDAGRVIEMDRPSNLLEKPNSHFYSMAKDANLVS